MKITQGQIDFYFLWARSQHRIHELEQRIEAIKAEALRRLAQ